MIVRARFNNLKNKKKYKKSRKKPGNQKNIKKLTKKLQESTEVNFKEFICLVLKETNNLAGTFKFKE